MGTGSSSGGIMRKLFGWLPNWVGFGLIIIAGIVAIVVGATQPSAASAGFIAFGVVAIIASILAFIAGARSTPNINPFKKSFGASVEEVAGWAWIIIFVLFVIAALIAIFVRG
jgi:hypothetical protein